KWIDAPRKRSRAASIGAAQQVARTTAARRQIREVREEGLRTRSFDLACEPVVGREIRVERQTRHGEIIPHVGIVACKLILPARRAVDEDLKLIRKLEWLSEIRTDVPREEQVERSVRHERKRP